TTPSRNLSTPPRANVRGPQTDEWVDEMHAADLNTYRRARDHLNVQLGALRPVPRCQIPPVQLQTHLFKSVLSQPAWQQASTSLLRAQEGDGTPGAVRETSELRCTPGTCVSAALARSTVGRARARKAMAKNRRM